MAIDTLNELNAYDLMRDSACLIDPVTDAYCYIEADASTDASSLYFYQLPLFGHTLPNITTYACSTCTKSLMAMYWTALSGSNASSLTGLQDNYAAAATEANNICGAGFAQSTVVTSHAAPRTVMGGARIAAAVYLLSTFMTLIIL